ncbi:hypothetical protein [Robbsia andropogonis]|nr:hypothetical protein [Robbsia andropogonis]
MKQKLTAAMSKVFKRLHYPLAAMLGIVTLSRRSFAPAAHASP